MGGGTTSIVGGTVNSAAAGANGIFSYGNNNGTTNADGDGTTVYIEDVEITTTGQGSGGIMTTYGGTTVAKNLTINTSGGSSAPIRTDRGGGWVTVEGGSYTSSGLGSPAIYSTAEIVVYDAQLTSNQSEGVCIEGTGSIALNDCTLTANNTNTNGNATFKDTIMIYQSQSGDASDGTSEFSMTGGVLNSQSGHVFHVTNTTAIINLNGVTINNSDSDNVLISVCDDGWSGAENIATLNAAAQTLTGDILVGDNSTLTLNFESGTTFSGNISGAISNASGSEVSTTPGTVNLTLDDTSKFYLSSDTYVTSFTGTAANVITGGFNFYVNGSILDGTSATDGSDTDTTETLISGTTGNDSIANTLSGVMIDAGAGDDFISNTGGNVTIVAGTGNDTISGAADILASVVSATVDGGNVILTTDDGSVTILDAAGETLTINGAQTIIGGAEVVAVSINNTVDATILTGTSLGDTIQNSGDCVTIDALDGDDFIMNNSTSATNTSINSGAGNDIISNTASNVTISSAEGNNTVTNNGSGGLVQLGGGDDFVTNMMASNVTIDAGGGDNRFISNIGSSNLTAVFFFAIMPAGGKYHVQL